MVREKHSGVSEKTEKFGGVIYRRVGKTKTIRGRNKKIKELKEKGYLTKTERAGIWHCIYARKARS
jgi:hypothetical protein